MVSNQRVRNYNIAAYCISIVVLTVVILMRKIHIDTRVDFSFLPPVYSLLNLVCAIILIFALRAIKSKNVLLHKKLVTIALLVSTAFLMMYVLYHITTPETKYCGDGLKRIIYFILLISHVILAGASFPFILFTYVRGLTEQFERHKKMARWVYWIWLYICISGPICYLFLMPCYK